MRRTRLTPEREAELYEAVLDILREVGYDALTMDAVAARTHSSKATLYRQWKGKPELVVSALRHKKPIKLADIDTGSVRGDLLAMVCEADDAQMEQDAALMRGLGHAIHTNADLHRALRELLIEPEMAGMDAMLRRAVDRGEIAADTPALDYVPHMMLGAFLTRPLVEDRNADPSYLIRYIDAVVLPALGL
ncbi:TetR/AcrR family transcriptional regulator [Streptomyces albireticuli]|uniref:TetR family transcriptional regulator n=1 Tax=Streptomyces albireticuli TaxID=1940 RepID=A0A2A2DBJ9_9ACTN|nr:TetR/AcrR family transcriptional regulator [Streptomyces albireticuli]MCD9144471.1 TetR/AcrR family transcriptional regulator [Streptomyces albireticuli]MCD9163466.1 TetR/AcrR family transcriptional regulator [Streptomyces albireticuli]MCD9193148.1 TetR/AcrR family transcriptional regulator [Streptomyces albireticuli]PAU49848.1 TetR family transcriptional regulator [Streptomyces albireticuli]